MKTAITNYELQITKTVCSLMLTLILISSSHSLDEILYLVLLDISALSLYAHTLKRSLFIVIRN